MRLAYLKDGGSHGYVDLPAVTTTYERIGVAYPNRAPRYCHPAYDGGSKSDALLGVWQWEVDGHAPGTYGSSDEGLPPVAPAPQEELDRLSAEITAALDEIHAHPDKHPEAADYLGSCVEYGKILREIDEPFLAMAARSGQEELDAATSVIGSRSSCTREEMAAIIRACDPVVDQRAELKRYIEAFGVEKGTEWHLADQGCDPNWWAEACRDITLVSITAGCIRFDQPGQLPGGKCATLMFAPEGLDVADHWADRIITVA